MVQLMLENQYLNLNEIVLNGVNASWIASYGNQFNIMVDIYEASKARNRQIDLNAKNKEGINALHLSAYYDHDINITKFYSSPDLDFDINSGTLNGYSPLCIAVIRNNQNHVKELLHAEKCNPNVATNRGITPLYVATKK